ncbi:M28 family metallopeptidase [Hyalangium rubrum]|uniref:M28 family metallopeptidase n=1 Tax=Hyalangium rubrum TaxID=3103134 RepID=A0ABU5HJ83_9BACT|nr:M28 family metallopeptidase [Hyalangium sp. s54d21]MDY7232949.1 M28 family metallopeptidase [Hyalangium sp. s54d21]
MAVVTLVGVYALVTWSRQPPSPVPADAPPTVFSEARAAPLLRHLAADIGSRPQGSSRDAQSAEYLAQRLREIPGLEVQVQDAQGALVGPDRAVAYRVRNILARLPGREPGAAVLISAHYDSHADAPGAGDNAVAVAAAVEVARALAAGPQPRHDILFNLNGGEEYGLVGADAFLQHPWAREVQAVINLDAAGPGGKSLLFRATPDAAGLLKTYASSVPHPFGSVVGEDLFRAQLVPSDTDFRVYRDRGLRVLDSAFIEDGYAYHTPLDTPERVTPGSLQHVGSNTLALARALAEQPPPPSAQAETSIYYDLLGGVMFVYSARTALALAGLSTLGVLGALLVAWRRGGVSPKAVGWGAAVTLAGLLAGLCLPVALALLEAYLFKRPHGWYATPSLAWLGFGTLALVGPLAVASAWVRRAERRGVPGAAQALTLWAGGLLVWALLQGLLVALGAVVAYLACWWLLPGALGLAAACQWPRWRAVLAWVAFLPGALLTAQSGLLLLELFIPVAGRSGPVIPFDPVIALLIAFIVISAALTGLPALLPQRRLGRAALALSLVAVLAAGVLALRSPYTPERPKRVTLTHADEEGQSRLWVDGADFLELEGLLPGLSTSSRHGTAQQHRISEKPTGRQAPSLEVIPAGEGPEGTRRVTLRWHGESGERLSLFIPRKALAGWSLTPPLPTLPEDERTYTIHALMKPDVSWEVTLLLRGAAPVKVQVRELAEGERTPALESARAALPSWVTAGTRIVSLRSLSL